MAYLIGAFVILVFGEALLAGMLYSYGASWWAYLLVLGGEVLAVSPGFIWTWKDIKEERSRR